MLNEDEAFKGERFLGNECEETELSRDLTKLETFKRQLMQSLNEDSSSQPEPVDIGTCDQSAPKAYPEKEEGTNGYAAQNSYSGSNDIANRADGASRYPGQRFSITPYITPRLTPNGTPKIISTSVSPRGYSAAASPQITSGATSPRKSQHEGRNALWYPSSQQSSAANSPPRGRPIPGLQKLITLVSDRLVSRFSGSNIILDLFAIYPALRR